MTGVFWLTVPGSLTGVEEAKLLTKLRLKSWNDAAGGGSSLQTLMSSQPLTDKLDTVPCNSNSNSIDNV